MGFISTKDVVVSTFARFIIKSSQKITIQRSIKNFLLNDENAEIGNQ